MPRSSIWRGGAAGALTLQAAQLRGFGGAAAGQARWAARPEARGRRAGLAVLIAGAAAALIADAAAGRAAAPPLRRRPSSPTLQQAVRLPRSCASPPRCGAAPMTFAEGGFPASVDGGDNSSGENLSALVGQLQDGGGGAFGFGAAGVSTW